MDELQDVLKQHAMIMKATTALFYGILVSIAMNFFWGTGAYLFIRHHRLGTADRDADQKRSRSSVDGFDAVCFEHPVVCFGVEADWSQVYAVYDFGSFLLIGHD